MPTFIAVGAGVDQRLARPRPVATLPAIDLDRRRVLDRRHHLEHAVRVPVRGVDDEHVDAGGDERLRALDRVRADADRRADAQPAALVLRRVRVLDLLLDVLDGDQPAQPAVGVDDRQLLDLVAVEDLLGLARASSRPAR